MAGSWEPIFSATDAEGDRLDVLASPDAASLIVRRNNDEAQTVELDPDEVGGLVDALTDWWKEQQA